MLYRTFILLLYALPGNGQVVNDSIVKLAAPEVIVNAGKEGLISVLVSVKNGYHIQANKVNNEFIIPTTLELDTIECIAVKGQSFPSSKRIRLEGSTDYLPVYDGNFKIFIPFKVSGTAKSGEYNLEGRLKYQACDDKTCFFPRSIVFIIVIKVV
jgi:hypothetical protein